MEIVAVETFTVDATFKTPFIVWRGETKSKPHVYVRVESSNGLVGWGEASPFLYYAPETASDVATLIDDFMSDALVGQDARSVRGILGEFEALDGHLFAKAAVETALWDLLGQQAGLPICQLLGGPSSARVPIITVLHSSSPQEIADEAREWVGRGVHNLKIKIGFGPEQDEAFVAAVREAVGPAISIRVDAEEHYLPKEAARVARSLERFDIELISQPVARTDWDGMAFLRESTTTTLLADEGLHSPEDVLHCVRTRSADAINIKVLKCGGLLPSLSMAAVAHAANLPVVVGSMVETGVGSLIGAHFAALVGGPYATELCGPLLYEDDLLEHSIQIDEGHIVLGDSPGLGARFDTTRIVA